MFEGFGIYMLHLQLVASNNGEACVLTLHANEFPTKSSLSTSLAHTTSFTIYVCAYHLQYALKIAEMSLFHIDGICSLSTH